LFLLSEQREPDVFGGRRPRSKVINGMTSSWWTPPRRAPGNKPGPKWSVDWSRQGIADALPRQDRRSTDGRQECPWTL